MDADTVNKPAGAGADGKENEYSDRLRVNLGDIDPNAIGGYDANLPDLGDIQPDQIGTIHPEAAAMYNACPWMSRIPIFHTNVDAFGPRPTIGLALVYFLTKGVTANLMSLARYPMFRTYFGASADRYQRLSNIANLGNSIKPMTAMLSDTFAFLGFTKRWYCLTSCVLGGAFLIGFASLPSVDASANPAGGFTFICVFCVANVDIMSEGHYSRLMRRRPDAGPSMVSWIWFFQLAATIVAAVVQGPLNDANKTRVGLYIGAALMFLAAFVFIFNMYGERRNRENRIDDMRLLHADLEKLERAKEAGDGAAAKDVTARLEDDDAGEAYQQPEHGGALDDGLPATASARHSEHDEAWLSELENTTKPCCCGVIEFNTEVVHRNWKMLLYSMLITAAALTLMVITILGTKWQLLYACIAITVVCFVVAFICLPFIIARCAIYFYCYALLYLQLPGALDTFYLATPECLPNGPHFSYSFYNTISAVIGNVAGIAAVSMFPYVFAKRTYWFTLTVCMSVQILASLFDLIIVERWNLYIGIPDHAMYLLGDAVVFQVCYYFAYMPTVMLLSRVCPRGSESMVYAVVAGFGNLGISMSNTVGSLLMELAWPLDSSSIPCDLSNIRWLLIVGHILTPLLIIPLTILLLPRARICDDINPDGQVVVNEAERRKKEREASAGAPGEPLRE